MRGACFAVRRLSNETWVHDDAAREDYINALLDAAERLAMHGNVTARAIGRCRHAIIPGLVEWMASEMRERRPPKELINAMVVAMAPMIADFALQTLLPERVKQLPDVSGGLLEAYLQEELAA